MLKLIYGTGNKGKLNLMREYLEGLDVVIEGLDQVDISFEEPEECGKDPLENARQKAEYYYSVFKRPVFSCDSGLYIEGLSDEEQPGVHVRNVNGRRLSDREMTEHYSEIAHRLGGKCKAKYVNDFSAYARPKVEAEPKLAAKGQGPQMRFLDRGK